MTVKYNSFRIMQNIDKCVEIIQKKREPEGSL